MQHNLSTPESLVHFRYNYKERRYLVDSVGICALWVDAERIHNVGRLMWRSEGRPTSRRRQGGLGAEPTAVGDFYTLKKVTRF